MFDSAWGLFDNPIVWLLLFWSLVQRLSLYFEQLLSLLIIDFGEDDIGFFFDCSFDHVEGSTVSTGLDVIKDKVIKFG